MSEWGLEEYFIVILFFSLLVLIPVTMVGIEFLYKFNRYGKFETKRYRYWREKKNV